MDRSLGQVQSDEPPLALQRALRIGLECAEALAALHTAGVVHGRFSCDHVRLNAAGTAAETVKVDGFGLAPLIDEARRAALAPEPASKPASMRPLDATTDIQQLGSVLRELVSPAPTHTRLPLDSGSSHLPRRIFDKIIARCFADRAQRPYPNAALLCSDLRRLEAALEAPGWKQRTGTAREAASAKSEAASAKSKVPATIHPLRARAQVAPQPALPKVIVALDNAS